MVTGSTGLSSPAHRFLLRMADHGGVDESRARHVHRDVCVDQLQMRVISANHSSLHAANAAVSLYVL